MKCIHPQKMSPINPVSINHRHTVYFSSVNTCSGHQENIHYTVRSLIADMQRDMFNWLARYVQYLCVCCIHVRAQSHTYSCMYMNYCDNAMFKTAFPVSGAGCYTKICLPRHQYNYSVRFISIFNFSELLNIHLQSFPFSVRISPFLLQLWHCLHICHRTEGLRYGVVVGVGFGVVQQEDQVNVIN